MKPYDLCMKHSTSRSAHVEELQYLVGRTITRAALEQDELILIELDNGHMIRVRAGDGWVDYTYFRDRYDQTV